MNTKLKTVEEIVVKLQEFGNPEVVQRKQEKFGVHATNSLGVYQKDINELVRTILKDSSLAIQLFETGIYEARIVCSKIFKPKDLTLLLADQWVEAFDNWEICDSFSMMVFAKSPLAIELINRWPNDEVEFKRRASFATMAGFCSADKKSGNELFHSFFNLILRASDQRPSILS